MSVVDAIKTISQFPILPLIGMVVGIGIFVGSLIWGFRSAPRGHEQEDSVARVQVVQRNVNSPNNQQTVQITQNHVYNYPAPPIIPSEPYTLPERAQVRILSPSDDQVIPRNLEVHAMTQGLSGDDDIWLVVYAPSIRRYYPIEVLTRQPQWKTSITVGAAIDRGSHFAVELFITNKAGSAYLRQFKEEDLFRLPPGHETKVMVRRELV